MTQVRVEAGRPDGGQFAKSPHAAPDPSVTLSDMTPSSGPARDGEMAAIAARAVTAADVTRRELVQARKAHTRATRAAWAATILADHPDARTASFHMSRDRYGASTLVVEEVCDDAGNVLDDATETARAAATRGGGGDVWDLMDEDDGRPGLPLDLRDAVTEWDAETPEGQRRFAVQELVGGVRTQYPDATAVTIGTDEWDDGYYFSASAVTVFGKGGRQLGTLDEDESDPAEWGNLEDAVARLTGDEPQAGAYTELRVTLPDPK